MVGSSGIRRWLPPLTLEKVVVPPGGEWSLPAAGWWLIHIQSGAGYALSQGSSLPLEPGVTLRFSPLWAGQLRASQLGLLELQTVRFDWSQLGGLISPVEEQFFISAQQSPEFAFHHFAPPHPLAAAVGALFRVGTNGVTFRVNALAAFVEGFGTQLANQIPVPTKRPPDAPERVRSILASISSSELIHLQVHDLAQRANCTPRHLQRIFRDLLGVSFREKQTQVRLDCAVQILGRSDTKVVNVALDCGFGSLSLFNAHFKKRFRVPPGKWRDRIRADDRRHEATSTRASSPP